MPQTEVTAGSSAQVERRGAAGMFARAIGAVRRTSRRVGEAEARAIMSGFYYVALGAVALVMGRRRRSLLLPPDEPVAWRTLQERSPREHSARQY